MSSVTQPESYIKNKYYDSEMLDFQLETYMGLFFFVRGG
jgi:hypothetical protein